MLAIRLEEMFNSNKKLKDDGDLELAGNYRGIALGCCGAKVFVCKTVGKEGGGNHGDIWW